MTDTPPQQPETRHIEPSGAAATPLGKALNLLGNRNATWVLAGAGAFGAITYFFSVDKPLPAFLGAVASFITLPMGIMARSFVTRNLPRGPVISALAGGSFGAAYGMMAGVSAIKDGVIASYLACVAFPVLAGSIGFVLLGGIANIVTSGPRA